MEYRLYTGFNKQFLYLKINALSRLFNGFIHSNLIEQNVIKLIERFLNKRSNL